MHSLLSKVFVFIVEFNIKVKNIPTLFEKVGSQKVSALIELTDPLQLQDQQRLNPQFFSLPRQFSAQEQNHERIFLL